MDKRYQEYLQSDWWQKNREMALKAANYKCYVCGRPFELQVHHLSYAHIGYETLNDLVVLCETHHKVIESVKKRNGTTIPANEQRRILDCMKRQCQDGVFYPLRTRQELFDEFIEEYKYRDYAYKNGDLNLTDLSVICNTFTEFCKAHGYAPDTPAPWSEIRDHFKYERYEVILRYYDQGAPKSTVTQQTKFSYQMITKIYNNPEKYRIRYQNKKDI